MANRLVELAIEALEARKAAIEEEIRKLRLGLRSGRKSRAAAVGSLGEVEASPRRRRRSAAARKAQSLRMKEWWARRRTAGSAEGAATKRRSKS